MYPEVKLLIDGRWTTTAETGEVRSPLDGSILGRFPVITPECLAEAVRSAWHGQKIWRDTAPNKRAQILNRAAGLLRERKEEIATIITMELGKPLAQSRGEVERACEYIEWDASECQRLYGRVVQNVPGIHQWVLREPVGVVAAITPWNFPLGSPARKTSGALAAGCSVILKAAEETPASAMLLAKAYMDAGLPPGVLNLVFGLPKEITDFLLSHEQVDFISFTGSVEVGKQLASLAGRHMKGCLMELGGHAPVIVCSDADPHSSARIAVDAKCRNSGQICVSATRFLVHDAIFDQFVDAFATHAKAVVLGNGLDPASQMGPLANQRRYLAVQALVADALSCGADLICGGEKLDREGFYFPLTVLANVPPSAKIMSTEPFGPIAVINRFSNLQDAISTANNLPLGLAGYVFTNSIENLDYLTANLRCGNIAINHFVPSTASIPFGGVRDSGTGREGGIEGLLSYTITKCITRADIRI